MLLEARALVRTARYSDYAGYNRSRVDVDLLSFLALAQGVFRCAALDAGADLGSPSEASRRWHALRADASGLRRPCSATSSSTRPGSRERRGRMRPFADVAGLHREHAAGAVRAGRRPRSSSPCFVPTPQLAGREAQTGTLTEASDSEQLSAGLKSLRPDETGAHRRAQRGLSGQTRLPVHRLRSPLHQGRHLPRDRAPQRALTLRARCVEALDQVAAITRLRLRTLFSADLNPDHPPGGTRHEANLTLASRCRRCSCPPASQPPTRPRCASPATSRPTPSTSTRSRSPSSPRCPS